ncbi:hypothetical protein ABS71_19025 [bacterium SCN 62-11]|nr:MAG: hypothetical protein ABS71_19025 [bacterium SCN 62-11]
MRSGAVLLEIIAGLLIILFVVLLVGSLFPSTYQGSLQAARMSGAVSLARQVLERQKTAAPAVSLGNQTVDSVLTVQGRAAHSTYCYRVDQDNAAGADPLLWKVTVQWEHSGKVKEIQLVGASSPK